MEFTYKGYKALVKLAISCGYQLCNYFDYVEKEYPFILRHDIDMSLNKALDLARVENEIGVKSTFFVLLSSGFYNALNSKSIAIMHTIHNLGHTIGLHFDEKNYISDVGNPEASKLHIKQEAEILSDLVGTQINVYSYHRPSKEVLDANLDIPGLVNCYGDLFFKKFKYLSDSRRRWREPVFDIVESKKFPRIQLLTHAFWYNEVSISMGDALKSFVYSAADERYYCLGDNFSDLDDELRRETCDEGMIKIQVLE